jgi:hypothetical protein
MADGKLRLLVSDGLSAPLEPWQFDTFDAAWSRTWWGHSLAQFTISAVAPAVESLTIDGAVLKRLPDNK